MAPKGFTLIEMIVALTITALVALMATPSLRDYLRDCRRAATVNAIAHAVHAARQLAGTVGRPVELCATEDGRECRPGTDWTADLLLRADEDPLSQTRTFALSAAQARQTVRSNREAIRFSPLTASATPASVTVCDDRGPAAAAAVIVSRTGRPRVAQRDASGRPLVCP